MTINYNAEWAERASKPTPNPATTNWQIYFKSGGLYILEDDGTEHGPFNATKELILTAFNGWPSTTNGCAALAKVEHGTNDVDIQSLDFDQTTQEHAQWFEWMPDKWDAGTVTFQVVWTAAAGVAAETVEWNLEGRAYADDDPIDAAWGTAVEVSDALIATGDMHISAVSAAVTLAGTPVAGEPVQFRVFRDIADNLAGDAKLLGVKVFYTTI